MLLPHAASLDRLLRPRSIAVIGGGFFGTNVVSQCRSLGYEGDVWPVHPTKDEVAEKTGRLKAQPQISIRNEQASA
jgi:acetate---CoA ligase (ADP-forming)